MAKAKIKGYKALTENQVLRVNSNKNVEESILRELDALAQMADIDKRWLSIGRTHLELAFMAINRSIMRPARITFKGE